MDLKKHNIVIINSKKFTIQNALEKINKNPIGYLLFVNEKKELKGIITEGDIRRLILKKIKLNSEINKYLKKNFYYIETESKKSSTNIYSKNISFIPILKNKKLINVIKNNDKISVMSPNVKGNESRYLADCISTNWVSSQGNYVKKFEQSFAQFHKSKFALSTSNGTAALELTIKSLNLRPKSKIIVPNLTFAAVINAVINCGHTPIILDVDKQNWLLDINLAKINLIKEKIKAVIFVHSYGISKDISNFVKLCIQNKIEVIEDCAESFGAKANNKFTGTMANLSIFSFFSNKLITTGEGGMALFKKKKHYELAKTIRDHGMDIKKKYWHNKVGNNYRMTNLQAAIGCAQMERFENFFNYRSKIRNMYVKYLKENKYIILHPDPDKDNTSYSYWIYTILINKYESLKKNRILRNKLIYYLNQLNIESRPFFYPLSDQPAYKKYKYISNDNNSFNLSYIGLSLPSSFGIKDSEIKKICLIINNLVK